MEEIEFRQEVVRVRPKLLFVARRYTSDGDRAEDAVQETLMKFWLMRDELRLPIDSLAATVVRNVCIDSLRRTPQGGVGDVERMELIDDLDKM